jgi:hypothetical protein
VASERKATTRQEQRGTLVENEQTRERLNHNSSAKTGGRRQMAIINQRDVKSP